MSETTIICRCGHEQKEHFQVAGIDNSPCVFEFVGDASKNCGCRDFEAETKLFTVISTYRTDRWNYAFQQIEAQELTRADLERAVNVNQEEIGVPDVLEELLSMNHYCFADIPPLAEKDVASIIANRLYPQNRIKIEWRLKDNGQAGNAASAPDNQTIPAAHCPCGHDRQSHDRGFGECLNCENNECAEFRLCVCEPQASAAVASGETK